MLFPRPGTPFPLLFNQSTPTWPPSNSSSSTLSSEKSFLTSLSRTKSTTGSHSTRNLSFGLVPIEVLQFLSSSDTSLLPQTHLQVGRNFICVSSPLALQSLTKCLADDRRSVNICWRKNEYINMQSTLVVSWALYCEANTLSFTPENHPMREVLLLFHCIVEYPEWWNNMPTVGFRRQSRNSNLSCDFRNWTLNHWPPPCLKCESSGSPEEQEA